ncbi:MAG: hypothetical protein K2X94_03565 [Amoebophilaceae bacterium]|nr:hypothetical protein [Amoebophilaceae bacterium]
MKSLALNRCLERKSTSNDRGDCQNAYLNETIGPAPSPSFQRKIDERVRDEIRNERRNERRGPAMLAAHAVGDFVTSQGDVTGCSVT